MLGRLIPIEHGRKACVGAFEEGAPFVTGAGAEYVGHSQLEHRPAGRIELRVESEIVDAAFVTEQRIELRFDGADGHVLPIRAGIRVIEMRSAVEQILPALIVPIARSLQPVEKCCQQRNTVRHRGIDDLTNSRSARFMKRAHHAKSQHHRAATEIADDIQRWDRILARAANGIQYTAECHVVDVMTCSLGQGAMLAPSRHTSVHQFGIAHQTHIGPDAQSFHDAWTETLDQHVRPFDQLQNGFNGHGLA
ncbi:hypothetical protein D9M73_111900 [compost metagenome]